MQLWARWAKLAYSASVSIVIWYMFSILKYLSRMLCWRTLRMECTQWVVTVAPPPLGFFYKPVWPLKHNCFRYMYHVNDGCVEGFPNILSSVEMHQILLVISILIHRHLFNVNTLWLSLILLSLLFKRRRENVLDHTMMTWVFYQSHLLSEARKQAWRKSCHSGWKLMIIKQLHEIPLDQSFGQLVVYMLSLRWEVQITVFVKCMQRIHFFQNLWI